MDSVKSRIENAVAVDRTVVFTSEARDDLLDLYDYIANRSSPNRALRYIERIEKSCASLCTLPERGTLREVCVPACA